jgi:hypothetical protein
MWAFIKKQKRTQQQTQPATFSTQDIVDHLKTLTAARNLQRSTKIFVKGMIKTIEQYITNPTSTAKNYILRWAHRGMQKARHLKDGTASGLDEVPPELVKHAPYEFFLCSAIFAADAADANYFPLAVEDGWLSLIYKKHNLPRQQINSFRGLRITSVPGKSIASMIADPIFPMDAMSQPAICREQFAGKKRHNADMLALMIQCLKHSRKEKPMYLLLMDIVKAFDKVNKDIIWAKLLRDGWPTHYIAWLRALYRHLRTKVRTSDGFTDFVDMINGIGQGDPNSTALYAAFLSDLPGFLRNAGMGWDFYGI